MEEVDEAGDDGLVGAGPVVELVEVCLLHLSQHLPGEHTGYNRIENKNRIPDV